MKPSDLKNGMMFETREKNKYYIVNETVYRENENEDLMLVCMLSSYICGYNDDFTSRGTRYEDHDIVKILDADGELLWSRVNWEEVPIDTKILVRDNESDEWEKRHYAGYDNDSDAYPFKTFINGRTSWTSENGKVIRWKFCKLANKEK